jgi:hypothetical protein
MPGTRRRVTRGALFVPSGAGRRLRRLGSPQGRRAAFAALEKKEGGIVADAAHLFG